MRNRAERGVPDDAWTVLISAGDNTVGTGIVIDDQRVLTCAHVVQAVDGTPRPDLWVQFVNADNLWDERRPVASVRCPASNTDLDAAILVLDGAVPDQVPRAPLRIPPAGDLIGKEWWAFGFARSTSVGNAASGVIGARLAQGWVRLDTNSRYPVESGFSGAGLWSPAYNGVVGVVGQANGRGDAQAVTLYRIDAGMRSEGLAALAAFSLESAGPAAAAAWDWTLADDPEAGRHWRPRARGVPVDSERGQRFRGRRAALRKIVDWLDRPVSDRRALVVTGSPGVGKSAVLARIVTTADAGVREALPADDDGEKATVGSVGCAVHAKGKTALALAVEIARAASAAIPRQVQDLAPALRTRLEDRSAHRAFNVVIDALDETATPAEARAVLDEIILPLAETCADLGVRVIVGTRRLNDGGDLVAAMGDAATVIDLNDEEYFAEPDLAAYALATLQLRGAERRDNPYAANDVAIPLAGRIAALADRNFLVAGLVARTHGLHDHEPVPAATLTFTPTVDAALFGFLQRLPTIERLAASDVFTVLAYAQAPGLPAGLWRAGVEALMGPMSESSLSRFVRTSSANFLIESSQDGPEPVYRLFHQALNEALLRARLDKRPRATDELALTRAFVRSVQDHGWKGASPYLLRSLPEHALRAGYLDELLADDEYLLHADLTRLTPLADHATAPAGQDRARLLRLTPQAIAATPAVRSAMYSITCVSEGLRPLRRAIPGPYHSRWASVVPRNEHVALYGHTTTVRAVCEVPVHGRSLVASAGDDEVIRIWDPATGYQLRHIDINNGWVYAVCALPTRSRTLVASAGEDELIRIWDPLTGARLSTLEGHEGGVNAVCAVPTAGRTLLASAGDDGTVRLWDTEPQAQVGILDHGGRAVSALCIVNGRLATAGEQGILRLWEPATGAEIGRCEGHTDWVRCLCPLPVDDRVLLASGGDDESVRVWDPDSGRLMLRVETHGGAVRTVHALEVDGRTVLATGSDDELIRFWDATTGRQLRVLEGHIAGVYGLCTVRPASRPLLVSASDDHTVRLWDVTAEPARRRVTVPDIGLVQAVTSVTTGDRSILASAGQDWTVRLWDPGSGAQLTVLEGHSGPVNDVTAAVVDGRPLIVSAGGDRTVRLWNPVSGEAAGVLRGHRDWVRTVCATTLAGRTVLASAGDDRTIRIWDPVAGNTIRTMGGDIGWVYGLCPITVDGRPLLASATADRVVRLWDPATGDTTRQFRGHTASVYGVCQVHIGGRSLLASASDDETVRLWDPWTGAELRRFDGHTAAVRGVCAIRIGGRYLLASAGDDRTVRIWGPGSPACVIAIPVNHPARRCTQVDEALVVGLEAGLLALDLDPGWFSGMAGRRTGE